MRAAGRRGRSIAETLESIRSLIQSVVELKESILNLIQNLAVLERVDLEFNSEGYRRRKSRFKFLLLSGLSMTKNTQKMFRGGGLLVLFMKLNSYPVSFWMYEN